MSAEPLVPASPAEAAEAIRAAQAEGVTLLPCGRRTRLARHAPAAAPERWLSTAAMDRILEFDAEDQTCVVEAGLSPAALDAAAAEHGLELGVCSPGAAEGTLGGLFLAPELSLATAFFGPPRDQVLGAEWLLADGSAVRTGARVVKSVAGYDLTRLFLGSRGRLALCTRLTLRLRPRPRLPLWCRGPADGIRDLPAPRLAFQTGPGAEAFALLEGVDAPGAPGWRAIDPAEGEAARDAVLRAFADAPRRASWPAGREEATLPWPRDLLGNQAPLAGGGSLPPGAHVFPPAAPSPWLEAIQQACAPGALPFGGRPA
jgi:hypothetical protein